MGCTAHYCQDAGEAVLKKSRGEAPYLGAKPFCFLLKIEVPKNNAFFTFFLKKAFDTNPPSPYTHLTSGAGQSVTPPAITTPRGVDLLGKLWNQY